MPEPNYTIICLVGYQQVYHLMDHLKKVPHDGTDVRVGERNHVHSFPLYLSCKEGFKVQKFQ